MEELLQVLFAVKNKLTCNIYGSPVKKKVRQLLTLTDFHESPKTLSNCYGTTEFKNNCYSLS